MKQRLKPFIGLASGVSPAGTRTLLQYFNFRSHRYIAALAFLIFLTSLAIGWFQYAQIDRMTTTSVKGKDNIIWDFYKLEVLLMDYQTALRNVVKHGGSFSSSSEVYESYNLFASQIETAEVVSSGQIMSGNASFKTAMSMSKGYIESADISLVSEPKSLSVDIADSLLEQSVELRTVVHKLVLDAYHVENFRATTSLEEMRRFTFLYGVSSFLLLAMVLTAGALTLRRLILNERMQFERAELLREKTETAEAANRSKARFLSSASHDLRQPAHALGLFMARLEQVTVDPQSKGLVANAMTVVRELQDMLDAMLDLSRLDSEHSETNIRAFPVSELFASIRSVIEGAARAKGLRLRIRQSAAWLESDSSLLQRILLNLSSNAIRYSDRGTVLVTCRPSKSETHARIEVWDSGIGISSEDQEKVFQEFYQVGNPQRDRRLGMGLGLSVVERCCRLLNLPLTLQSQLGVGTRVTLLVPLATMIPKEDKTVLSTQPFEKCLSATNVMLIEDDEMGRVGLAGLLESWGYSVIAVGSSEMAVEQASKTPPPEIIISDLRLGGENNGNQTISILRSMWDKEIPAFLISGDISFEVMEQVKSSGLMILKKPVRPAKLRSAIRNLLRKDDDAPI